MKTTKKIFIPRKTTLPGIMLLQTSIYSDNNNYCLAHSLTTINEALYYTSGRSIKSVDYICAANGYILLHPQPHNFTFSPRYSIAPSVAEFIAAAANSADKYDYWQRANYTYATPKSARVMYDLMGNSKRRSIVLLWRALTTALCGDIATLIVTRAIEVIIKDTDAYMIV